MYRTAFIDYTEKILYQFGLFLCGCFCIAAASQRNPDHLLPASHANLVQKAITYNNWAIKLFLQFTHHLHFSIHFLE